MQNLILLFDDKKPSTSALAALRTAGVPIDELPAHAMWEEIEYPVPCLFDRDTKKIYKGLEEIEKMIGESGYGKPS